VCVVHFCNFDWLVKRAWMLPHPAHLTRVTQNCTSFLNSPLIDQITGMVLKLVSIKEIIMKKCTMAIAVAAALLSMTAAQASEFSGAYISGKIGYNTSSPTTNHTMNQLYPGLEAGYGWDIGSVLLGVNGFVDWHTNSITANDYGGDVKLGFPMGEFMPYAKLGETGGWPGIRNNFALGFEYKLDYLWSVASELFADSININGLTERNINISVGLRRSLP
jgi:Outer membrane protein beta-barrel domain